MIFYQKLVLIDAYIEVFKIFSNYIFWKFLLAIININPISDKGILVVDAEV